MRRFLNRLSCVIGIFLSLYVLCWTMWFFHPMWLANSQNEIEIYGQVSGLARDQRINRIFFTLNEHPMRFNLYLNPKNHELMLNEFSLEDNLRVKAQKAYDGHYVVTEIGSTRWQLNQRSLFKYLIFSKWGYLLGCFLLFFLSVHLLKEYLVFYRHLRWFRNTPKS